MKKHLAYLILLLIIITSCQTSKPVSTFILNPPPVREEQEYPENIEDLANMIVYYEGLVREWESWAIQVYDSIEQEPPESLKLTLGEE